MRLAIRDICIRRMLSKLGMLLLGVSVLFTVAANLLLREGVVRANIAEFTWGKLGYFMLALIREPLFIIGAILYGAAALVWFRVIASEQLSFAYPILVSFTFILITLGAFLFFRESVSLQKVIGLVVILAGIAVVATS